MPESLAQESTVEARIPGCCDARAEGFVEGVVEMTWAPSNVPNQRKANLGIIYLASQRRLFARLQKSHRVDRFVVRIH